MLRLRGTVLWPVGPSEAVFLRDGVVGPGLPAPRPAEAGDPEPVRGLIIPAFADWHFHWVQLGIAGRGSAALLDWLASAAWPAEERFADEAVCRAEARHANLALAFAGTLCGAAYGSPHAASAAAFLDVVDGRFLCGPAVMTTGEPAALLAPLDEVVAGLERLADDHGEQVAVAPRFGPSCDAGTLRALGALAARRGLAVQTHLAETEAELRAVRALHADARDYTDVYERAGLLGPRTLLGHVIHVSDDELARIAAAGAVVVHCPSSNAALGSGRMPLERLRGAGVPWVLGSDVGAGPQLCLLDVMAAALDAHAGHAPLTAVELFHRATIGPAAIFAGGPDTYVAPGGRPGSLVVERPAVAADEEDPEVWLMALLDRWRGGGGLGFRRASWWGTGPGPDVASGPGAAALA